MIIKRYTKPKTQAYIYVLEVEPVTATADALFVGAIDGETIPIIEEALAKQMFYQFYRKVEMMHKRGELPRIVHK